PALLRAHCGGRAGALHRDHVLQPGGGDRARSGAPERAVHSRDRHRLRPHRGRLVHRDTPGTRNAWCGRRVPRGSPMKQPEPATPDRMPAVYLGHGAPILVDDPIWPGELARWSAELPRPKAILVVSAHWENAPLTIGATTPVPLFYDFYGFPRKYYDVTYPAPGAPDLAQRVRQLLPGRPIADEPTRGLDHGP